MNKGLVILLVVCLVSVHGFVKRDLEDENIKRDIDSLREQVEKQLEAALQRDNNQFFQESFKKLSSTVNSFNEKSQGQ